VTKSARRRSAIGGGLVHDAGEFGRGGDRRRRSSARAEFEVSAELGRAAADISEVDRGGDRRRRSAARAERSGRARAAPRPSATWCRPCRARAAADTSAAVAELDQEHAGEVDRGGDRRRGAARPRAAPRPIGGDVVQTDRRTAATWCRPCRARAAPRPTSAQRSPSSSSTRGTPGSSAAAASVASWCTTSDLVRSRPISSDLVRSRPISSDLVRSRPVSSGLVEGYGLAGSAAAWTSGQPVPALPVPACCGLSPAATRTRSNRERARIVSERIASLSVDLFIAAELRRNADELQGHRTCEPPHDCDLRVGRGDRVVALGSADREIDEEHTGDVVQTAPSSRSAPSSGPRRARATSARLAAAIAHQSLGVTELTPGEPAAAAVDGELVHDDDACEPRP